MHERSSPTLALLLSWFAALEDTPSGRLMLTNLLHAFRTSRLPVERLRAIVVEVARTWRASGKAPDFAVQQVADRHPEEFLCQPPAIPPVPCSRVVDDATFVGYLDLRERAFEYGDYVPRELLDRIELEGLTPELIGESPQVLKSRRPLTWVTRTEAIASLRERTTDGDELATQVRDQLGLAFYWADHLLLEVQYPEGAFEAAPLTAPTFIDGGTGVLFRARSAPDGWGRAVDLATHDDGLPEAVHTPVPLSTGFAVRRLGRVLRGPHFVHAEVIQHAEHPWSTPPADLLAFLTEDQ
jgi:hypothetical protein